MPQPGQVNDAGSAIILMCAVVIVCFLAAIPLFTIFNAYLVDKTMDTGLAVLLITAVMLCVGGMMAAWGSLLMWLALALLLGLNFALPAMSTMAGKVANRQMTTEDIERNLRVIQRDPKNAAAHGFLGDAYMKVGRFADAARSYEEAIRLSPQSSEREKYQLKKALEKVTGESRDKEICPDCHAEQSPGQLRCAECGHYMKGAYLLQEMSRHAAPAGGVMLGGALIGSVLPAPVNGLVGLGAMIAGSVILYQKMKD